MEYLPQADKWIEKQKAIEANASRARSQGHPYRSHRTYKRHMSHRHTMRYKRHKRYTHRHRR
jgi:hypothetical protein